MTDPRLSPSRVEELRAIVKHIQRAETIVDAQPPTLSADAFANQMAGLRQLRDKLAHLCSPTMVLALLDEVEQWRVVTVQETPEAFRDTIARASTMLLREVDELRSRTLDAEIEASRLATLNAAHEVTIAALNERLPELIALRREMEALRADKARLDWIQLQVNDQSAGTIGDLTIYGTWGGAHIEIGASPVQNNGFGVTIRDAIDVARSASSGDSEP